MLRFYLSLTTILMVSPGLTKSPPTVAEMPHSFNALASVSWGGGCWTRPVMGYEIITPVGNRTVAVEVPGSISISHPAAFKGAVSTLTNHSLSGVDGDAIIVPRWSLNFDNFAVSSFCRSFSLLGCCLSLTFCNSISESVAAFFRVNSCSDWRSFTILPVIKAIPPKMNTAYWLSWDTRSRLKKETREFIIVMALIFTGTTVGLIVVSLRGRNIRRRSGMSRDPLPYNLHTESEATPTVSTQKNPKVVRVKPIGKDGRGDPWTYGLYEATGGPCLKRSDYPERLRSFAAKQGWEMLPK